MSPALTPDATTSQAKVGGSRRRIIVPPGLTPGPGMGNPPGRIICVGGEPPAMGCGGPGSGKPPIRWVSSAMCSSPLIRSRGHHRLEHQVGFAHQDRVVVAQLLFLDPVSVQRGSPTAHIDEAELVVLEANSG